MSKIIVVGGINYDTVFSPYEEPLLDTSNPGKASSSFGGVALNVARHLGLERYQVKLLSVVGDDRVGEAALQNAQRFNVDVSLVDRVVGDHTATYYAFSRPSGQLFIAFADMDVMHHMTKERFAERLECESNVSALVVDGNVPRQMIGYLLDYAERSNISFRIAIGVSVKKMDNFRGLLSGFDHVILNQLEADALLRNSEIACSPVEKVRLINQMGVRNCLITLGGRGLVFGGDRGAHVFSGPSHKKIVDESGAGDAFAAGFIDGLISQKSLADAILAGFNLADLTLFVRGTEPRLDLRYEK